VFVWDEAKRQSNLEKHGLDFRDAHLVYDDPEKCTYVARSDSELRWMDIALALVHRRLLALIYTKRAKRGAESSNQETGIVSPFA
jgi:uncharacterized protein